MSTEKTTIRIGATWEGAPAIARAESDLSRLGRAAGGAGGGVGPGGSAVAPGAPSAARPGGTSWMFGATRPATGALQELAMSPSAVGGPVSFGAGTASRGIGAAATAGRAGFGAAKAGAFGSGASGGMGAIGAAAAVAIPVAIVAMGAGAVAALVGAGLSQSRALEPSRRNLARGMGQGAAAAFDPMARQIGVGLGFSPGESINAAGSILKATGSVNEKMLRRTLVAQQGLGIGTGQSAGMMGSFARKGGDPMKAFEAAMAAGSYAGLERARMPEMVDTLSSMADGRAPGMRPIDEARLGAFLGQAGRVDPQFRGIGGRAAAQGFSAFTQSQFGQAVMLETAAGQSGGNYLQALKIAQEGPFAKGGVGPKAFMKTLMGSSGFGGRDFGSLSADEKMEMGGMMSMSTGGQVTITQSEKILAAAAGGNEKEFSKLMDDAFKDPTTKAMEVANGSFNEFARVTAKWDQLITDIGDDWRNVIMPIANLAMPVVELLSKNATPRGMLNNLPGGGIAGAAVDLAQGKGVMETLGKAFKSMGGVPASLLLNSSDTAGGRDALDGAGSGHKGTRRGPK